MTMTQISTAPEKVGNDRRGAVRLSPRLHKAVASFLDSPDQLGNLVDALGSPLNVLFPQLIDENVQAFASCLERFGIRGRVYFAHKSNRSDCLVRQLSLQNAFIDVASANELKHALGCGFAASRIEATGPKNTEFLALCLMHGITISVDSASELLAILKLRGGLGISRKTSVLLRVCGFRSDHSNYRSKASRFGIPVHEIDEVLGVLEDHAHEVELLGFAFHVDTVSIPEKALAIENCLALFDEAFSRGLEPRVLSIGGGFKANYLANESDWHQYTSAIRDAVLGSREPLTWQGNSFGLIADKGALRGSFNSYSYFDPAVGPKFLEELLSYQFAGLGEAKAGSLIRDNGIELWIEPGRALLDQTGMTVARVNSLRSSSQGDTLVALNMKRQDLCFLDQEFFVDPVVITSEKRQVLDKPVPVYFSGNLCLESDLVYRHQTFLDTLPEPGDMVVFPNTAGYFMDFSASESIMQPVAKKVAVFNRNGEFAWTLDEQYHPWLSGR